MFKERMKSHHISSSLDKSIPKEKSSKEEFLSFLNLHNSDKSSVLYIHIPFCDKICSFCNLNRKKLDNDLEEYTAYLVRELTEKASTKYVKNGIFEAIYFGGGTPTILKVHQLELIFKTIKEKFNFHIDYEWTLETTLHNLSDEKIKLFNKYGINRLSVGIQTFSDKGRAFLNRTFTKDDVIKKIKELKDNFNGLVCCDIIYNYAIQEIDEVVEDAKLVKSLNFDSSSFYSLMIHEGSELSQNEVKESSLNRDYDYYKAFYDEIISDDTWELMELTKFVKKNRDKYKYISLRNNGHDTLAIGVGSGGTVGPYGTYNMNEKMSFFMKDLEIHQKYRLLSGLLQFHNYNFHKIKKLLSEVEFNYLLKLLTKIQDNNMGTLTEEQFSLNIDGIFWGNNISKYLCDKLIEKELGND